jgi:hypothetical protein
MATVAFAVVVGAASAVATPLTPAPGATVTTAHPLFQWSLPSNEDSQAIYLSSNPATTPEGRFHDENVVDVGLLNASDRQWSPTSPLYAGSYWWLVWSTDRDSFASLLSSPSAFTTPVSLRIVSVRVRRYTFLNQADVSVGSTGNVKEPVVAARAYRGRRLVWRAGTKGFGTIGSIASESLTFRARGLREGALLLLRVTVSSGKTGVMRTVRFRAP